MATFDVSQIKNEPKQLLDFLKENRYAVYHRSNIFFRDFQYGLWRYLRKDQSKVPYAKIEGLAREVIADWEAKGIMKQVDRQSFELNMPEYSLLDPATLAAAEAAPAAAPKAAAAAPAGTSDPEKAAKIAELQAKMAEAKAKREGASPAAAASEAAPAAAQPADAAEPEAATGTETTTPTPTPVTVSPAAGGFTPLTLWIPPGADAATKARIETIQAKMNEARARAAST